MYILFFAVVWFLGVVAGVKFTEWFFITVDHKNFMTMVGNIMTIRALRYRTGKWMADKLTNNK